MRFYAKKRCELLFADDVNKNDSSIKAAVDRWYRKYIKDSIYEDYIEDTIYCNDRSISDYGGWGNNGQLDKYLRFRAYVSSDSSLRCTNETDKFSINNPKAQLTYPIGLMTIQELRLINKPIYKNTYFWTMSPGYSEFGQYSRTTYAYRVPLSGTPLASLLAYTMSGYRPVISLKPNVTFESGDGSMDDPYVVDMDSFSN